MLPKVASVFQWKLRRRDSFVGQICFFVALNQHKFLKPKFHANLPKNLETFAKCIIFFFALPVHILSLLTGTFPIQHPTFHE